MRDGPRSGARWWAMGEWSLRWKVTALVALPLAVALALGAVRITGEWSDAQNYRTMAERLDALPSTMILDNRFGVAASGLATGNLPNEVRAGLVAAVTDAQKNFDAKILPDAAQTALGDMLAQSNTLLGMRPNPAAVPGLLAMVTKNGSDAGTIITTVLGPVSNEPDVGVLKDAVTARSSLVGQFRALQELMLNPKGSQGNFQGSIVAERSLFQSLARHFPEADKTMADINGQTQTRANVVAQGLADKDLMSRLPEFQQSLLGSTQLYTDVANEAVKRLVAESDHMDKENRSAAIWGSILLGLGLLIELTLAALAARSLLKPLRTLRNSAQQMADRDLPAEIDRIKDGASVDDVVMSLMPVRSREEVGQLARAVDNIHGQALRLAGEQAQLRLQVSDMFETLARRSKSLVDHQLGVIEAMEYEEKDPKLLEGLFRLDHLAARMRRNSDNLLILAGTKLRRLKAAPVEIGDVLRAAISEVEEYQRVKLGATPRGSLTEPAASDIAHLFAELLDNALRASPPETDVKFTFAQANDQGLLIEVADRGIGIPAGDLAAINRRLEAGAEISTDTARHMGLFVVSRLAERHGLTVRMRPTFDIARDPGVTVTVHVPRNLIIGGSVLAGGKTLSGPMRRTADPMSGPMPAATSGEIRHVTRTAAGNMMITVDTGGDLPSLPQRHPGGSIMPEVLPARQQAEAEEAAMAAEAAPGLPRRGPGGLPQRRPGREFPSGPGPIVSDRSDESMPVSLAGSPAFGDPSTGPLPFGAPASGPLSPVGPPSGPLAGLASNSLAGPPSGPLSLDDTRAMGAILDDDDDDDDEAIALGPSPFRGGPDIPESHAPAPALPQRHQLPPPADTGSIPVISGRDRDFDPDRAQAAADAAHAQAEVDAERARAAAEAAAADARRAWNEAGTASMQPVSPPTPSQPGKHGKADTAKTASFFQSRLKPASVEDTSGIPIFAEMMSGWLADWQDGMPRPAFESIADEGWSAAQRVAEASAATVTESGLPQRNPGERLIPGSVGEGEVKLGAVPVNGHAAEEMESTEPVKRKNIAAQRDPESIRSSLARHQAGVRDGRAMSTIKATGNEGER